MLCDHFMANKIFVKSTKSKQLECRRTRGECGRYVVINSVSGRPHIASPAVTVTSTEGDKLQYSSLSLSLAGWFHLEPRLAVPRRPVISSDRRRIKL